MNTKAEWEQKIMGILTKRNGVMDSEDDAFALDSLHLEGTWQIGGLSKRVKEISNLLAVHTSTIIERVGDKLDEQEFYELCQSYRHCPLVEQELVTKRFEALKKYIIQVIKEIKNDFR